jgi:type I restriction-modification system DNA methylase subunit
MAKFDHIIMNPPYSRNLHLKILSNALDYSDDIVNLSPVRWLQDPLAELKKE